MTYEGARRPCRFALAKIGSSFAKHFQKNEILVPHLNNWFANAKFDDEIPFAISIHPNKEKDDAFHPSSATKCSRALFAQFRKDLPEEKPPADAQKIFMFGHFSHAIIQKIVVELGFCDDADIEKEYDFHFETELGNPYRVRGFLDIARCTIPNRGTYLVDIKTMNARIYAQQTLPEATMEKYEAQVKLYLEFENLDEAIILAVEKDTPHRFREIIVKRDTDFVDGTIERWEDVVDALAQGRVPDCTCLNPGNCPVKGLYPFEYVS